MSYSLLSLNEFTTCWILLQVEKLSSFFGLRISKVLPSNEYVCRSIRFDTLFLQHSLLTAVNTARNEFSGMNIPLNVQVIDFQVITIKFDFREH